jgi:putative ubiquitin-RnfH superfamily antitoxin RatB of RatAB toxin-antitoxin module
MFIVAAYNVCHVINAAAARLMSASDAACIRALVVYLHPGLQWEKAVELRPGSSLRDAVLASGVLSVAPELTEAPLDLGVFGRPWPADRLVRDGDRVEIYRPLIIDPKESRRLRAALRRKKPSR